METIIIECGKEVICDFCNKDYTNSNETGGALCGSSAVCPECTPRLIAKAKEYNEEHIIGPKCPEYLSFRDWVYTLRQQGY